MNLNIDNWKEFRIGDLFDIHPTKALEDVSAYDCVGYGVPLVVNQSYNNGVAGLCDFPASEKGGIITFSDTWEGETFFYQPNDFIGFAHVQGMYPKNKNLSKESLLFVVTILEFEARGRYSYGRKKRRDTIMNVRIKLPVDKNNNPDWKFMEDYIKSIRYKRLTTTNKYDTSLNITESKWKEFRFGELISDVYKAKAINRDDLTEATEENRAIRYITRTGENNGCELLADIREIDSSFIEKGNAITVGDTTSTCFYQDAEFIAGDHIVVIRADKWLNLYTAFFVLTILNGERFKYSYGRAFLIERIKETIIRLPVDKNNNPDWKFMENYIKSLPYGDRLNG